jgi:hypothetical protein
MPRGATWVYAGARAGNKPSPTEKAAITAACEKFIADTLLVRNLPHIHPSTEFNYPVAIHGKWHANKYRFLTRYRSETPRSIAPEFDAPFARIDYVGRDRFDLFWHRHTGTWHCVGQHLSLAEALQAIDQEPWFVPC